MRSRYTAYAIGEIEYLVESLLPRMRKDLDIDALANSIETTEWDHLEIIDTVRGGTNDQRGIVEFKAFYVIDNQVKPLHERSKFQRKNGHWFYVDGEQFN